MAIIPAHNEEAVVGNLVESLKRQNYDKELYDIYVIADNCTDNTAKIAKEAGAIVYERFNNTKKTKGYALDWFLQQKIEENASYDAFFVFDADNIVDPDFIKSNRQLDYSWIRYFLLDDAQILPLSSIQFRIITIIKWNWIYGKI